MTGFNYLAKAGCDLQTLVAAFITNRNVKLIQRPRVIASNGKPARLFLGETIPYVACLCIDSKRVASVLPPPLYGVSLEITPTTEVGGLASIRLRQEIVISEGKGASSIEKAQEMGAREEFSEHETVLLGGCVVPQKHHQKQILMSPHDKADSIPRRNQPSEWVLLIRFSL